jgi:hypothetical protein
VRGASNVDKRLWFRGAVGSFEVHTQNQKPIPTNGWLVSRVRGHHQRPRPRAEAAQPRLGVACTTLNRPKKHVRAGARGTTHVRAGQSTSGPRRNPRQGQGRDTRLGRPGRNPCQGQGRDTNHVRAGMVPDSVHGREDLLDDALRARDGALGEEVLRHVPQLHVSEQVAITELFLFLRSTQGNPRFRVCSVQQQAPRFSLCSGCVRERCRKKQRKELNCHRRGQHTRGMSGA